MEFFFFFLLVRLISIEDSNSSGRLARFVTFTTVFSSRLYASIPNARHSAVSEGPRQVSEHLAFLLARPP